MISVIIAVRDGKRTLEKCLAALKAQSISTENYEILVIDDGSKDGSGEMAQALGMRVITQKAAGAAAARNRGIQEERGEIVLFTDADCVVDKDWVEKLSKPLLDGVEGVVGWCGSSQSNWVAKMIQVELDERYAQMGSREQIDFLSTGNCGFRREVLLENPFDESFKWLEDVELSFRLAQNGNRMVFVPEAKVYHHHPESLWKYVLRKFRYASYAPEIYRRYPGKMLGDSRTPVNRRMQLVLLGVGLLTVPFLWVAGLGLLAGSLGFSWPVVKRAFRKSIGLGLVAPVFVLAGNLGFLAGFVRGFLRPRIHTN